MLVSDRYDEAMTRRARAAFLAGRESVGGINPRLERSWRRSRLGGACPEVPANVPFVPIGEEPPRLLIAAEAVVDRYAASLRDTATSIVLADRRARIVGRWTGSRDMTSVLEDAHIAAGFTFTEEAVGTNGLGTALQERTPVVIRGAEHFAEMLHPLTCVGSPILHPVSRHVAGVINIACPTEQANELLLPMVRAIGQEVEHRLYEGTYERERALLERFLRRTWGSSKPVITITNRLVLANPAGARLLEGVEQSMLWEQAACIAKGEDPGPAVLRLGPGDVRVRCHPVEVEQGVAGVMIEVVDTPPSTHHVGTPPSEQPAGVVGRSQAWSHVRAAARDLATATGPALVSGEPGAGKSTVAQLILGAAPDDVSVVDAAMIAMDGTAAWLRRVHTALETGGHVLLTHLDALSPAAARGLAALLDANGHHVARIVGTCGPWHDTTLPRELADRFTAGHVEVPPLRVRHDDIRPLVEHLTQVHAGRAVPWRTSAVQPLLRFPWPGNVRQLANVVRAIVTRPATVEVRAGDLPDDVLAGVSRRPLSRMESVELEAIQAAMVEADGNKRRAAEALGISRSTLYRRLTAYGLDLDHQVF